MFAFLTVGCGAQIDGGNYPGMTADGDAVYVAYGAEMLAIDTSSQSLRWQFAPEGNVMLFANPSIQDGRLVIGDYGSSGGFFSPGVKASVYVLENLQNTNPTTIWSQQDVARDRLVASPAQTGDQIFIGTADNQVLRSIVPELAMFL